MRGRHLLAGLGLAGALALGAPTAAAAHDSLTGSSPSAESTVETVDEIELTFSNVLLELGANQRSTAIQVRQDDRYFETGCPVLSDRTVSAPVALGGAGDYEVIWQVVSSDGHPTSGTYTFTYAPAEGTPAAEGSASPACSKAAAESGGQEDVLLLGAAAAVVALAAVGVLVAVLLSRRRSASAARAEDAAPSPSE
ncbi:copper resistance CopC family protein [Naasia sp. SYSU D00948]|uniref:copper resistance CopC family protein n=1 Tax=Naasia sp. SYSU D00948 TaxID=2817379 RepID=UPI001B30FFE7|nr:copper resistance CopC family protein [Naasia sp. SYSU D00948]